MRRSRPDIVLERRIPSPKKINPPSPPAPHVADPLVLDWGLLSAAAEPSKAVSVCCVCGEAHDVAAPDELNNINSENGNNNKIRDTNSPPPSNHRRRGGGGADESFVVLPADSNPVLSESYFSLPRNGFSSGDEPQTYTQDGMSVQADDGTTRDLSVRSWASSPLGASTSDRGGLLPQSGGMSIIGDGPAAGWTRAGFGAGSTMLESIAQISHAGLSDSVRKECFLHNLAKKRPARRILEGAGSGLGDIAGIEDGREGAPSSSEDPILCWHCCSSLLDRIEEDSRLADRESLAHREFVDTLDGIEDNEDTGMDNSGSARHEGAPPQAADGHPDNPRGPRSTPEDSLVYSNAESTFAKALEMAQQTSDQLRTEMSSIEGQRRALCVRASNTWKALSELAWARRVLGEECRELLQVSKEVAEKASDLSERTALRELFSIRHDHGFPTINGYRLARAPDDKRRLHWNEINAAWGEAVLLVRCVANAVGFCSRRFRLVPMSCASRVIELGIGEDGEQSQNADSLVPPPVVYAHDLFSTGGRNGDSRYRILGAIQAFVSCSSEVMAEVERHVLERRLFTKGVDSGGVGGGVPYRQTEDSIGGMTIASLKNQASWKAWLCQLVKNLGWALEAASSLCVS